MGMLMSDIEWFCAECEVAGSREDVLEHHRVSGHMYAAGENLYLVDLSTISVGVTGWSHEGVKPTWVHANFCHVPNCGTVLNDDEVREHIRRHISNGELPL